MPVETAHKPRFSGPNGDIPRPAPVEIPPMLDREPVVHVMVIGRGIVSPLGNNNEDTWKDHVAGKTGIVEHLYPPYTDPTLNEKGEVIKPAQIEATTAGTVKDYNPRTALVKTGFLPGPEVKNNMEPYSHYAATVAFEAMLQIHDNRGNMFLVPRIAQDGKLDRERQFIINSDLVDPRRVGVFVGCGFGGGDVSADAMKELEEGELPDPDNMMKSLADRAGSLISKAVTAQGGAETDTAACASHGKAMKNAILEIQAGNLEVAIVVGTEGVQKRPVAAAEFDAQGALDKGKDPAYVSRSLHKDRRGFTMGEGAVCHVIAHPDWVRRHGIQSLYDIVGYGNTSGAGHNTQPNGPAEEWAMRTARRRAERNGKIEGKIINVGHYTGTPLGDGAEALHTQNVLEDFQAGTYITGPKRLHGHMLGAAGGLSLWVAGEALINGVVPGTPLAPDGELMDEVYGWNVPQESVAKPDLTDALVNQFGFGDANVTLWARKTH